LGCPHRGFEMDCAADDFTESVDDGRDAAKLIIAHLSIVGRDIGHDVGVCGVCNKHIAKFSIPTSIESNFI